MSDDIICKLKPKFVFYVCWLSAVFIISIIIILQIDIILIKTSPVLVNHYTVSTIIYISILLYLICEIIRLFFDYKNYKATTYTLYPDKIEFEEGFINHKYAVLKFSDIKEIHLTQSFIQRLAGLGSIKFVTAANAADGISGLWFRNIENSKDIYKKVKDIQSLSSN